MSGVLEFLAEVAAMLLPSWVERRVGPEKMIWVALAMLALGVSTVFAATIWLAAR